MEKQFGINDNLRTKVFIGVLKGSDNVIVDCPYCNEQVDKMMQNVLNNEKLKNKMLKDFGFDVREYTDEEMGYILCAITEQGGLTDKVKAAKALYIVDQIVKFACMHDKYQDVGGFTMDLLKDCGVLHFEK